MTRLFCRPCHVHHPPAFPFGRFNDPPFLFNFPTRHQFKFQTNIDDEPRGPMAISLLQVGPLPVASSHQDTHPSASIEKRYALLHFSCAGLSMHRVVKPTLGSITCALTSSLPTGAPPTRCEHSTIVTQEGRWLDAVL